MATINTPAAGVSPYQAVAAAPTVLRAAADGTTVLATAAASTATVSELAATNANTLVVVSGQAALNSLITSGQPGVFDGANVTINLEEQNFTTTNQVTSTINSPSGNTGEIQYNSGSNSFASSAFFTFTSGNVVTPGIRTNGYFFANGAPFTAPAVNTGNFVFTSDNMTISHANSTLSVTGNGTGNVNVSAGIHTWIFEANGNLTFPTGMHIDDEGANTRISQDSGQLKITAGTSNASLKVGWSESEGTGTGPIAQMIANGTGQGSPGNVTIFTGNQSSTTYSWTFDNTGNLTAPGNITAGNLDAVNLVINSIRSDDSTFVTIEDGVNITTGSISSQENLSLTANAQTWTFRNDGVGIVLPGGAVIRDTSGGSLVIGVGAGALALGNTAVAIGYQAAFLAQGNNSVAIGRSAGETQGEQAVAIGLNAGRSQGNYAVAIGKFSANSSQGEYSVAIGPNAGFENQLSNAVSIGSQAGASSQGINSVAVGVSAAYNTQGNNAVAIGNSAAYLLQGLNSVAIGDSAGIFYLGNNSIAIGANAGNNLQGDNSIVFNATGSNLRNTTANTFTVAPVRNDVANTGNVMFYNATSNEITYGNTISVTGNITGNYFIGNGSQLTSVAVPSQTILPTIQIITAVARSAGLFGGGQGGANVTVANTIPVTEYGVIITAGTVSETYKTGALGSLPGPVSLTFTTGLNSTQYTLFAYVTSNAGTYYSNAVIGTSGICLLAGTQIALSDGTHKAIEDITYTDKLLSWDFDRGCYAETTAMWIKRSETGSQYNLLTFSDGTNLRTFDQHRIFNKQAGAFTYPMTDATPVGTVTVNEHGQEITLTNKQVIQDTIEYYNVITDYHMNLFSDSVLTSCRFNNIYPITDMKFVKDARTLRTRAEFENVPDRFFHGLRLAEQTTDIETVEWYVDRLLSTEVSTHAELAV